MSEIKIRGQSLDIKITDAEIKDINATMEPLSKLSSLFSKDLSVSIGMHFTKDTKLDQDLIESIKELSTVKSELTFNAHLEK